MTADAKPKRKRGEVYDDSGYDDIGVVREADGLLWKMWSGIFFAIAGLIGWCWRTFMRFTGFVWRITSGVFMWALRLSGRILAWAWDKSIWAIKLPFRLSGWLLRGLLRWYHGAPVDADAPPLTQLHGLVRRFYRRRSRFIAHGFGFAMVNGLLWLQYVNQARYSYYSDTSGVVFFTGLWLFFLAFHFMRMKMGEGEDSALRAVIEQHGYTSGYEEVSYESSRHSRLAADDTDEDSHQWEREQYQYEEKPKRR